jgi:hypothetical protein
MKRRLIVTVLTGSLMLAAPAAAFAKDSKVDCSRPGHGGPKVKDHDKGPGRHGGKVHDTDWPGHGGKVVDDARVNHGGPACKDD